MTFDAVYEDNVLKPIKPIIGLLEHQTVSISIEMEISKSPISTDELEMYRQNENTLSRAFGDTEPDYSARLIRERNPEYRV